MRKRYKIAILALTAAVATTSVVSVVSCGKKSNPLDTDWAGKTVCYELPTDGSTPDQHTGIENIGYMVYRLQNQPSYYSEMHGSVSTMIEQTVETYKQYNDGVMIASDISISSMVKTAQQTCFVGDYVLWRGAATGAADWDGLNTKWETNDPTKITVEDYKANYGLPGTDFSVYILNEDTVLSASDVTVNADGTYTQTFELNPETDAAPYYYRQKMLTTGGLDEWPVFSSIRVTYTFDSTWQILSSVIDESYSAKMIVSVGCNAHYVTTYEYETPKAESSDYEDYYSNYADKPVSELPSGGEITAAGCLTQAFGEVLTGPAVFNVSLTLNGTPVDGVVYVDINNMDIRAAFGNLRVWYAGEEVYLALGDLKAKVSVEEFASLLGEMMPEGSSDFSEAIDVNALLEQLGNGAFVVGESQATLDTQLSLFGMDLPVCFTFCLGDSITLGSVRSDLSFGDFDLSVSLTGGTDAPAALPEAEKGSFIELMPYVNTLVDLFTGDAIRADLSYASGDLSVSGQISVGLKDLTAAGAVSVVYGTVSKQIAFSFDGETVYLNLDGIKLRANAEEAIALIGKYVDLPDMQGTADIDAVISAVLSLDTDSLVQMSETGNTLQIAIKGTELLKAFGVEFELGDVMLNVTESGLTASAYGATVAVTAGEAFTADTEGYTDIVKYAGYLIDLFSNENLKADISFANGDLALDGTVALNLKDLLVKGEFVLSYKGVQKDVKVIYGENVLYLGLEGLKVKASVEEALGLVKEFVAIPETDGSAEDILLKVLSLNFGEVIDISEDGTSLSVVLKGTELLKALGVEFELGDVALNVTESGLTAFALGAEISVTAGEAFTADTEGYTDIVRYAGYLIDLFSNENLKAELSFASGDLALSGNIDLNLSDLLVKGEFVVSYKGIEKDVKIVYGENVLYLELEGLKVKASVEEALGLVKEFVAIPETDGNAEELILKVLSLNFGEVIDISEDGTSLSVIVKGTELLKAFGVEFELGDVSLNVTESGLTASAYDATVAVTAGEEFTADTEGYTDIVKYAGYLIDLFSNENLKAELSFANGDLALDGTVALNLNDLLVKGEFVVSYKGIEKDVKVIYGENVLYLELEGLKVKASVEEALWLVKEFVAIPETDGSAEDILLKVLSLNFGEVINISEDGTSLSVLVKGTELLKAFGVEFELGDVVLNVTESGLTASAYGAEISVTAGEEFTADTEGYTDIVKYAGYLIDLFSNENLKAELSFANGDLALDGTVALNLKDLLVKGEFVVSYKGIEKDVKVIYGENVLYLELEGLKVKASVEEALGLVKEFVAIPETDGNAEDILLKVLSLNFGEVIAISEDGTALSVVLKGTELLKAFGVGFELGDVALNVTESGLTASAYGATVAVTAGEAFTADTEGYTDIVRYAGYLIDLFSNENLKADIAFASGDISVNGAVALNLKDLLVKGEFVVSYKDVQKDVKVIYGENVVYLELDGLKIKASVEEALGLVKEFVSIPETDSNAEDILLKVLSLNFGEVIAISEDGTALSVVLKGTELLKALGVEFELGDVMLNVTESGLTAFALGAEISVMAGEAFTADTEGYTDIVKYAGYLIDLFTNENLKADISFANGDIAVSGTVALNLNDLLVKGEFVVSYKGIEKDVKVIYGENVLYLELEGLKVKANAEEALGLVKEFVSIPETDGNAEDILLKVLSLNFGEVIGISEDGTSLSVVLKGTELLKALGVDFALGDVALNVTESGLTASAYGATVAVTAGEAFTADTEGYTDIVRYAGYLIDLFSNENLKAELSFANGDLALDGTVALNLKDLLVKGEFVVSYKGIEKDVKVIYGENVLYLELEGLKVKASVEEALGLVKEFVAIPETDGNAEDILLKVLSLNFGEVISVSEDGTALSVVLKGTELLKAFGVEFELGDVMLNVTESGLTASAYGAEISVTAGEAFTADTEGYTDIVKYAGYLIDLFSNENLKADISFASGDLALSGNIDLNLKNLLVKGEFVVSYKGVQKDVKVIYGENVLYLELEGLKVKASAEEALGLVKEFVAIPETDGNAEDILLKVLSLNFGEVIAISEDGTSLSVLVKGTELLKALGVEFELGDVMLNVTESGLTASAYGATVAVTAGEAFTADTEGYADAIGTIEAILSIVKQEEISIIGAVDLTIGTTQVNLIFDKAAISWKDGFKLYAEMTVYVAGTQHDILLQTDGTSVQIAYGAVGATLSKEELPTLEEAIVTLYNRIKAVVDEVVVAAESPLSAIAGWEDLLALLGLGEQLSGIMDTAGEPIGDTVAGLLGQIEFCAPTQPNGIFVIRMGALTAELLQNPADEKLVFQIDYAGEGFAVSAEVHAEALAGAFPAISDSVHLLTADDFAVLCDYIGSAAESLLLDEITVGLEGTVLSTAEEYAPFGGVKYAIDGQIDYRSGGTFPVSLDLDGKKITVSPDVYAHIGLDMVASLAGDQSLYLDFYLLDANPDGSTDGILDLYLSVSRFAESAAEYAPLNLYLPADDLMTAVSAVLSMAGLDSGFLNETIVSEWLDVETTEQLRALGDSLKGTLGLDELLGALGAVSLGEDKEAFVVSDIIRDFTVTDEIVSLTLDSDTVYGASMPDDIFLSLTKGAVTSADGATRGYLSSFRLENVYTDATAAEKIALSFALAPSCAAGGVSIGSYYNFTGVGQLLKTLAKSATHPAGDGYAVNDYFFLNGTVDLNALSLLKVTVNIEGIAVYLDEDFNVAVDMRISYPGVQELNQVLINGDSSVDLSIRGGMVYMKRVQTSEYYWNTLISMKEREIEPVTLYRVMPLDRFLDDILNQLVFLFNFGDLIADQIAGSEDPAPAESVAEDYGAMIASYLTSYSYAAGTSPAWTVVLNGASLTDDVMGDIGITLSTSADGILSGLTATTSVYSVMDITAQLTYRNPRGQMQEGVTDPTVNIGEYLEREMSKGLAQADWGNTLYLEAAPKSANFIAVGELLNTQTVLCDTATNAIYTQLSYPDLSAYPELTGYRLGWKQADVLPADGNIYANYVANVYTVTILSEREAEGMTFDGALGMWKAELPYTYGTKLELPAGLFADKAMQTVSYTDADGIEYFSVENILSDLTLTAHWDYIEYTVQFVADGEIVGTQTAHYGDAIEYPEIPEKTGYDVVGWNSSALTAEGDMTVEAVYAAKTFTVTLYSEFELDGFAACEGGYTLALAYTYGETLALPVGVEKEHHFLNVYEDAEGKTYTVVENILSDLTLTARWEELGYKVDFVADGVTVATHNYYEGDSLNPPAVPGKAGYVGSWDIPEGYTVSGDDTVYAVYTPATYTVTVYSDLAADGFAATGDGRHSYSFDYTYGSAAVVLDPSLKVPCYDFGGYTLADGTPVSQVENIVSDLAVYVVWVDNTVTVRLSSDAEFNGYEGYNAADGYYLTVKFNDVYDLTQSLTAVGYKQFGWWTEANGSWERVTSVAGLDGAAVWAAWIADDLNVTVTEASTSLGSWGGTWTIGGTYQGGKPYGDHSKEIFSSVGVSRSDGVYYRASKDGVSAGDTLSSGDLVGVSGGTFYKSGMTSAKGSLWKYGGADAHITYSYGDLSVTVDSATVFRKK